MLKKYVEPILTKARLTDDIMNAALEKSGYELVPTDTARNACYMYMAHRPVWDEELEDFRKEAFPDEEDSEMAMEAVADVSAEVESAMLWNDIREYRETINMDDVSNALSRCKLAASVTAVPFLIAAFVVGGPDALSEYEDIMEEEGLAENDIKKIVETIGMEE